ncbi:hypothetical protein ES707_21057 [subsurface metagenome]
MSAGLAGAGIDAAENPLGLFDRSGQVSGFSHQASMSGGIEDTVASVTITWVILSVVSPITISGRSRIFVVKRILGAGGAEVLG